MDGRKVRREGERGGGTGGRVIVVETVAAEGGR